MSNAVASASGASSTKSGTRRTTIRLLLTCGVLSSALYAGMLAFIPRLWADYDSASWTVSELSAIGAPTRWVWVSLAIVWTSLYAAFGSGVWLAAEGRALRALHDLDAVAKSAWPG